MEIEVNPLDQLDNAVCALGGFCDMLLLGNRDTTMGEVDPSNLWFLLQYVRTDLENIAARLYKNRI